MVPRRSLREEMEGGSNVILFQLKLILKIKNIKIVLVTLKNSVPVT